MTRFILIMIFFAPLMALSNNKVPPIFYFIGEFSEPFEVTIPGLPTTTIDNYAKFTPEGNGVEPTALNGVIETYSSTGNDCYYEGKFTLDLNPESGISLVSTTEVMQWDSNAQDVVPAECKITVKPNTDVDGISIDSTDSCIAICDAGASIHMTSGKRL
ncbi:MAG: hypothetical protein R2827_11600 [Bdellovibrionales bacterium]